MVTSQRTVLITGGSSGIGLSTTRLFASRGWFVYELSRHGQNGEHITHISCDVSDEQSVHQAVEQVFAQTQNIDVVISNAGFGISGPIEFTPMEDVRKQFDVNVYGAVHVVQAVLPYLRHQGYGQIIFTSSVAAVLSIPYQAFYSATKAAINAIALALQNEVRDWNITVSVLMPGDVATGFTHARKKTISGGEVYAHAQNAVEAMEKDEQSGMSAEQMARQLFRIATRKHPFPQYVGGVKYQLLCVLDRLLPKRFVNWIVGKLYR